MMYYTLTLITTFRVISPIFKYCFLQCYYINTLYRQLRYSTVMQFKTICFCAKSHATAQLFAFFRYRGGKNGGRKFAGKTGHRQRFVMQFSSYCLPLLISLSL